MLCFLCLLFSDAREMLEYNRQGQSRQQGMLGRHQGVKGILGLDGEDMPPASMANMYWSSDFSRKLSCVKQYHSAERSVQSTKVNTLYKWYYMYM